MVTNWLAELDGRRVKVEVPASSANLGAGYDCVSVALGLTNRVEVEVRGWSRGQIDLTVDGEGATELIHIGQAVINLGGSVDFFVNNAFNYPTLAEA